MKVFKHFKAGHEDYVHDIAYDFYGRRLATASSDQKIKVWDMDKDGNWKCTAEFRNHSGSVLKVAWAHPEFGQILASCSSDRQVNIYEEQVDITRNRGIWQVKCTLSDFRAAVQDIKFAPRHHGLKLATCSLDGSVRIYEASDIMNLTNWPLSNSFEADKKDCQSLSWNPSPFENPMIVVAHQTSASVWEFGEKARSWVQVASLAGHGDDVHDVAWAPSMGRSYHLIATACKDHKVRIFKLTREKDERDFKPTCIAELPQHQAEVWRVEWNVTGTVLASTGDDATCRLWKSDYRGQFIGTLVISTEEGQQKPAQPAAAVRGRADDYKM